MTRILIVDDKPENLYLLHALLAGCGCEVTEARHGAEALVRARQAPPNLVISDLLMPVMDGYTLLRQWKMDERLRQIPFVVYTATYTEPKDEQLALDLGADAFILKPTEPEPFIARIREVLARQASGAMAAVRLPMGDEDVHFKQYSESLIRKLEEKATQLELANRALEQDIAQRRQAEAEREKLQAQLIQAQKMESVGRLAGGVAHDFNNILSVILGYSELALNKVAASQPLYNDLKEIRDAAVRSAEITRQLLAFARKQAISPRLLDLNETVESMLNMLRRLIGEDIELAWRPGPGLRPVMADPSQIDQILANLCVNGRDAIAGSGKLTIQTSLVTFDDTYCAGHVGSVPGDYVLLAVSDNGCGMAPETLAHLFEPFFTTKESGKGTGLGLATVYGIVKQNNGYINVYSEPATGTTFKVYLPLQAGDADRAGAPEVVDIPRGRGETVLVVEDDAAMLKLARKTLAGLGYEVLEASTPAAALGQAEARDNTIHLLLTDVVMPEMNGRELAERLRLDRPGLKVLYMSGYTADAIAQAGVLREGIRFVQKPFTLKEIAVKVRQALDAI